MSTNNDDMEIETWTKEEEAVMEIDRQWVKDCTDYTQLGKSWAQWLREHEESKWGPIQ